MRNESGSRILGIGDVHCAPGFDNERLGVAGDFCAWYRPNTVVFIGDLGDMPSLNRHRSRMEMEGSRYDMDCECVRDGLSDFMRPLHKAKKKLPDIIITLGNHENYIQQFISENPKMKGKIDLRRDLGLDKFNIRSYDYQDRVPVDGFLFTHNIATKTGTSADVASPKWGFIKKGVSMVTGHTHTKVHMEHTLLTPNGGRRKIHGINLGCFIHPDMGYQEHWSRNTEYTYDRGLWTFDNARDGDAKVTFWRAREDLGC